MAQLNPFELKSVINDVLSSTPDNLPVDKVNILDSQEDKKTLVKLLFKELYNLKTDEGSVLCFLLERYADKDELIKKMWELLKNNVIPPNVKIVVINFLRGLDSSWELDAGDEIYDSEIIDMETAKLLDNAVVNPEVQIDFLDFLTSLSQNDKITLINSIAEDYSGDVLANILIPVFLSQPDSDVGKAALRALGESKSQLAFHAVNTSFDFVSDDLKPLLKKSLSTLKIAGIREDNSYEFYKNILKDTVPYKCCVTYPDGHGNQALIFTRKTKDGRVRFVAVVVDDYHGIRDCFGFYDISQFECDKIIERFYKNEEEIVVKPEVLKTILMSAEMLSKNRANNWLLPYEYVCWKNLLSDIEYISSIKDILSDKLSKKELNADFMEVVYDMDFMNRWFLDYGYSDEFDYMLSINDADYDRIINENLDKVFYKEEVDVWSERLLSVAYLKYAMGDKSQADVLYSLYFDAHYKKEFFRYILRRSIYEYYVNLKFNTDMNNGRYTLKELDEIIAHIEGLWVCTK